MISHKKYLNYQSHFLRIQSATMSIFQLFSLQGFIISYHDNIPMEAIPYDPLIDIVSTKGNWAASTLNVGGLDENS